MRTVIEVSARQSLATKAENRRLSLIIAGGSPTYLETVGVVLDFHEIVNLVGRAASFEEAIQLPVTLRPDLVLMDLDGEQCGVSGWIVSRQASGPKW